MVEISACCDNFCVKCYFYVDFSGFAMHEDDVIMFRRSAIFFRPLGTKMVKKGTQYMIRAPCKSINPELPLTYYIVYFEKGSIHVN